jgi:hypothetical protein
MATKKAKKETETVAKSVKATKKTTKADPPWLPGAKEATRALDEKPKKSKVVKPSFKIPKKIGDVADMLYDTRQTRLDLGRKVSEYQSQETQLKNYIIDNLPKSSQTGASGKVANVKVVQDTVFQAEDWDKLYEWIKKTGNFQVLNRALNQTSINDIYENSDKKFKGIPGIIQQGITKVSVTKV